MNVVSMYVHIEICLERVMGVFGEGAEPRVRFWLGLNRGQNT